MKKVADNGLFIGVWAIFCTETYGAARLLTNVVTVHGLLASACCRIGIPYHPTRN
jgi:hypothetical protein